MKNPAAYVKLLHASSRMLLRAQDVKDAFSLTGVELRSVPEFQAWEILVRAMKQIEAEGGVPDPSRHRTRCKVCHRIASVARAAARELRRKEQEQGVGR